MMYIYKITNLKNNKIYIGKTINIKKRWERHQYLASTGTKRHLYNAMRYYGVENFTIDVVETCLDEMADDRERFWIEKTKSYKKEIGYNKSRGGEGGNTWELNDHKEQTSKKISSSNKGKTVSQETRDKISNSSKGKKLTEKQKYKISNTLKSKYKSGELVAKPIPREHRRYRYHSDEAKKKMSQAKKGKTYDEIYKENAEKMRNMQRQRFSGKNNPNYKEINPEEIYNMINNGCSNKETAEELNISIPTMINYLHKHYNVTPTEIRKKNGFTDKNWIFSKERR